MEKAVLFERLGLSHYEAVIYEAVLQLGAASVSDIARHAGVYRPLVYKYMPALIEKNLIAKSQNGKRRVYVAESPRQLESLVTHLKSALDQTLPELMAAYTTVGTRPVIAFFEGKRGIRFVYEDLLTTCSSGEVFYRYESPRNHEEYRKYIPSSYREKIKHIERFVITNEITTKRKTPRLGRLIKAVPPAYDLFVYDITQLIYGDKVAFIDFKTEIACLIESPMLAQFQKKIFRLLFDKL